MGYKAYGCIVVDTDNKAIKALHTPVILDLVADKVRSRVYSVLLILLIVIATAYWSLGPAFKNASPSFPPLNVSEVTVVLPQSFTVAYGGYLRPFPVVEVVATDGTLLAGRQVYVRAAVLGVDGWDELATVPYIPSLTGELVTETNGAGQAIYYNISFFGSSTSVSYQIYFSCDGIDSSPIPVIVYSNVVNIVYLSLPLLQVNATIGETIDFDFELLITDINNAPLSNKLVSVSVSPYPNVQQIFPNYGVIHNNENVTDESGMVYFSNLIVAASNQPFISLQFNCEGISLSGTFSDFSISLKTNVTSVVTTGFPPPPVLEGTTADPIIVSVFDNVGNSLSDKYVIAMITIAAGLDYYPTIFSPQKVLFNVLATTDDHGRAVFDSLEFSVGGVSGNYSISFYCDGVVSLPLPIFVKSSVAKVQFLSGHPLDITLEPDGGAEVNTPVFLTPQVIDFSNNPIPNKFCTVIALYDWGNGTFQSGASDAQGTAMIWLDTLVYVQTNLTSNDVNASFSASHSLLIRCDTVDSPVLTFTVSGSISSNVRSPPPAYLQTLIPPSGVYTTMTNVWGGVQPFLRLVDSVGRPVANYSSIFPCSFNSALFDEFINSPSFITPVTGASYSFSGIGSTDSNGYFQFGSNGSSSFFGVTKGYSGTALMGFCTNGMLSDVFPIHVIAPISSVTLIHPSSGYANAYNYVVAPYSPLNLSVNIKCTNDCSFATTSYPAISVLLGPTISTSAQYIFYGTFGSPYFSSNYELDSYWIGFKSNTTCVATDTDSGTCTFGDLYMKGPSGSFVVVVDIDGVLSNPISITLGRSFGDIEPVPTNNTNLTAVIQSPSHIQASVIITDSNGNPYPGMSVFVLPCSGDASVLILNVVSGCSDCSLSSISDQNGLAYFNSIQFYSGPSGTYQLCFSTTSKGEFYMSAPWNAIIQLTNPIYDISMGTYVSVISPGPEQFSPSVLAMSILYVQYKLEVFVLDGPSSNVLVEHYDNYGCYYNTTCTRYYDVYGADGYYTAAFTILGFLSANFTFMIDSVPTMIKAYPLSGNFSESGIFTADLLVAVTVELTAITATSNYLYGTNFTISVLSKSDFPVTLAITTCSSQPSSFYCLYDLLFTDGASGVYDVLVSSGPTVTQFQVNLTNPITSINVLNAGAIANTPVSVASVLQYQPVVQIHTATNTSLVGRPVNVLVTDVKGRALNYVVTLVRENGMAYFSDLSVLIEVPGEYQLQFVVAGVASDPIPFKLINPAFPSYTHLSLHHTQEKIVLGALLVVPLFLGNSARHPAWQMVFSAPAFAVICYVAYTYLSAEISNGQKLIDMGAAYYMLDMSVRTVLISSFLVFFWVVGFFVYDTRKKRPATFFDIKVQDCRPYIRHELLFYGMKRYDALQIEEVISSNVENEHVEHNTNFFKKKIQHIKEIVISYLKKPKEDKPKYTAFYFPMRLLIGFGTSMTCAFFTVCALVLGIDLALIRLDYYQAKITSLIGMAQQLQDFTSAGTSDGYWTEEKLKIVSSIIGVSTQQLTSIISNIQEGSTEGLEYLLEARKMIVDFKEVFHRSAIIALVISAASILVIWIFVFRKYKQRIFHLRRGRMDLVTRNEPKFLISGASTYVGLQTVHTAVGLFFAFSSLFFFLVVVQAPSFWRWVWSYFPLLVAFLLGLPFLSKTTTKFIISRWVTKHEEILHFRIWAIFDFMWIFVNLLSSIVLTVLRLLFAVGSSIIYAIRMDTPLVRAEYDYMDFGFKAYMGMMMMDHRHNNPILLALTDIFIQEMKELRKERKSVIMQKVEKKWEESRKSESSPLLLPVVEEHDFRPQDKTRTKIISKWWLLITLHNNPTLRAQRKHALSFMH